MITINVINTSKNTLLIAHGAKADTFLTRLKGLLGKKGLEEGQGLVIKPCNSVHMIWMKFPIDVIFVDKDDVVCHIIEDLSPGKIGPVIKESAYVVEVRVGTVKRTKTEVGDIIKVSNI
jgi:uncharacterized membrane protein (UPF0127 family)